MLRLEETLDEGAREHSEADEEEAAMLKALAEAGLVDEQGEATRAAERVVICSCGLYTCGAIGLFGHPVPTFKEEIEPLWPQSRRDERALALKG